MTTFPTPSQEKDVDASVRLPVMIFFGCAASWLALGTFLGALAAIKLVWPGFLDGFGFLTYGRIAPAAVNALVYGWASSAGLGIALWLLARLGRTPLRYAVLPVAAAICWNFGVFLGVCAILAGYSRGIFLLEFPGFISAILFGSYLFVAVWGIVLFRNRSPGPVFASSWYLLAALLWFPWMYFSANALLIWYPVSGSAQAPIAAWFAGGMMALWLTPIALASALYLIPQILGRRLVSYNLSVLGFWSFAIFAGWSGTALLIGGPVPAWMASAGIVASIFLCVPVLVTSINLLGTMSGSFGALQWSPSLRFTVTGAFAFLIAYVGGALLALPSASANFFFSDVFIGQGLLLLIGFVSMCFFGAIYYIVPRLLGRPWCCDGLIALHFWLFLIGGSLAWLCLIFGGLLQGYALNDPGVRFSSSVGYVAPFRLVTALSLIVLFVGSKCFSALLFLSIFRALEETKSPSQAVTV
jgi:cytochrome c oxidase cbb3-type subunit I